MITLIGALCLVIPHLLTWLAYGSGFEGPVDSWATFFTAVFYMAYITLDNVDGKQARRTKCTSPLGQIFDHGMDTITFNLLIITGARYS